MLAEKSRLASPHRRWLNVLSTLHFPLSTLSCLLFPFVLAGCGTGEYERRLEIGVSKAKAESKFNNLYGPQELADTPVSVRLPRMFTDSPLVEGALVNGQPVDERRVKPMLFPLPWLKLTYETLVEDPQGVKLPCYCYVAAVDIAGGQARALDSSLKLELQKQAQFDLVDWADFQGESADGRGNQWKKFRFTCQQEFRTVNKAGQEQYVQLPGLLEIYLHEEAGQQVLIAWRMPASIEGKVELAKWTPVVAGCVSVKK